MRKGWLVILVLVLAGVFAAVAVAAPHFTRNGAPTCRDIGNQLVCSGELAGLGNQNLRIDLTTNAEASFACGNPGRKSNQAPGINKVPFKAGGSQTIEAPAIKNGRARFEVFAPQTPPPPPDPEDICPNGNWTTVTLTGVDFRDIVLDISQGGVLLFHCTFTGVVPSSGSVTPTCSPA
jgi:hypothetical protein